MDDIINNFVDDNSHFLTKHQIDSYNEFIHNGIKNAIKEVEHPIQILKKINKNDPTFTHIIKIYFGGLDTSSFFFEKSPKKPNECRIQGTDYDTTLKINVYVEIIENNVILSKKNYQLSLLNLPIMLHSSLCLLNGLDKPKLKESGECIYEKGGYFIVGGLEKVILTQERPAINYIQVQKISEDPYTWRADVRSREEGSAQVPQATYIKYNNTTRTYWVLVPYIKNLVPLAIIFRALGIETDKDIVNLISGSNRSQDLKSSKIISDMLVPSLNEGSILYTQTSAIKFLATLTTVQPDKGGFWKENIIRILSKRLFPHSNHESNKFLYKAVYLGYMTRKLIFTQLGFLNTTDKDSLQNRQFQLPGELITEIFRDFYSDYIGNVRKKLYNRFEYKKEYRENFKEILTELNSSSIFDSTEFNNNIKKSFRGRWGKKPNLDENLGIIQDLQRLSFLGSMSHLRRTHLFLPSSAKLVEPRRLHCSQIGFLCPIETPDGGSISQLKHLTVMSRFSSYVNPTLFYSLLLHIGMNPLHSLNKLSIHYGHKIFINGHYAGNSHTPDIFVSQLLSLRRNGHIHYATSISWNIELKDISIYTNSGRLLRPLRVYNKNKTFLLQKWNSMVNILEDLPISEQLSNALDKNDDITHFFSSNKQTALIEFIDCFESSTALIALKDSQHDAPYTHVELSSKSIFGVSAMSLPFVEHNPAHRSLFAVGQGKQAVSIYTSNFNNRLDQTASLLYYPSKPLVHGNFIHKLHNDELSYGFNAIVAIGTITGYNQEDSIIINKSSIEKGMFLSSYTHTHSFKEENSNFGKITRILNPILSHDDISGQINNLNPLYDYTHLDQNGIIKIGTILSENMVLIGAVTYTQSGWIDSSIIFSDPDHHEIIHKTFLSDKILSPDTSSKLGHDPRIAKVSTIQVRPPLVGDKFAARSAQKGTIGLILSQEDMPYSIDGVVPDIILNPHAIPTRMTFSYFHEMLSGLLGLSLGSRISAGAFHGKNDIAKELVQNLKHSGFEHNCETKLINGSTGVPIQATIFRGPMFYQRLKQQVMDKIQSRSDSGGIDQLTQQPAHGKKVRGGLRLGEMERDSLLAHGISQFVKESYHDRSDKFAYSVDDDGFLVPDNKEHQIFPSHNFTQINTPYAFKLLKQEIQTCGVQMKMDF
jgi:DNA-directed RNA polymerase II subunit RPB2